MHVVAVGDSGIVSVVGGIGKLTTSTIDKLTMS